MVATSELKHGTPFAYQFMMCRCEACRAAHNSKQIAERKRRTARLLAGEAQVRHGIYTTYINWSCRCDDCKAAARAYRGTKR